LTVQATVDLVAALIPVFSDRTTLVRVTGFAGMGYVVGLILFMFPEDTLNTVDCFVVHEGPRRSIVLEVTSTSSDPIQIRTEKDVATETSVELLIQRTESPIEFGAAETYATFAWKGWVANELQLAFSRVGASCTQEFLEACSNLLVAVAPEIGPQRFAMNLGYDSDVSSGPEDVHKDGIQAMLGSTRLKGWNLPVGKFCSLPFGAPDACGDSISNPRFRT
jgi:hypothetical protein